MVTPFGPSPKWPYKSFFLNIDKPSRSHQVLHITETCDADTLALCALHDQIAVLLDCASLGGFAVEHRPVVELLHLEPTPGLQCLVGLTDERGVISPAENRCPGVDEVEVAPEVPLVLSVVHFESCGSHLSEGVISFFGAQLYIPAVDRDVLWLYRAEIRAQYVAHGICIGKVNRPISRSSHQV